jgi:hypothetical protein
MKKAVVTLVNRDPKGTPIGDLVLTMEFVTTLPAPSTSLFSFTIQKEGQNPLRFSLICDDAGDFFKQLEDLMYATQPDPITPATVYHTADSNGNPNGTVGIKTTLYIYTDPSGSQFKYYSYSLLPDSDVEMGFLLGTDDADVFYYDFDCFLSSNPPNSARRLKWTPAALR